MKIFPALHDHKRRTFLKLSGLLGLGVATATLLPFEKVESVLFHKNMYKVSQTRTAMGTLVNMTVIHSSRDEAENAMGLAFAEVDRTSRYAFIYTDDVRPLLDRRVSVSVRSATIDELLSAGLKGTELTGRVRGNQVIIS